MKMTQEKQIGLERKTLDEYWEIYEISQTSESFAEAHAENLYPARSPISRLPYGANGCRFASYEYFGGRY